MIPRLLSFLRLIGRDLWALLNLEGTIFVLVCLCITAVMLCLAAFSTFRLIIGYTLLACLALYVLTWMVIGVVAFCHYIRARWKESQSQA